MGYRDRKETTDLDAGIGLGETRLRLNIFKVRFWGR
jgi:hypothetical protein